MRGPADAGPADPLPVCGRRGAGYPAGTLWLDATEERAGASHRSARGGCPSLNLVLLASLLT